jgi:diguanylate cyclase (GGDEF)-like protein
VANHNPLITNKSADIIQTNTDVAAPTCPVGEASCEIINQVISLQKELNQLTKEARTDPLTGLFNFRHFRACLEQEMERTRRTEQPTTLIIIDLDFFKRINDNWGHEVGNQALVAAAKAITRSIRNLDILCRYGGEEFTLILPATDLLVGLQVAERVRAAIESHHITVDNQTVQLTASLGVDIYNYQHDNTAEQFIARADKHLYQAKKSGRNCVRHGAVDLTLSEITVSPEERSLLSDFFGDDE